MPQYTPTSTTIKKKRYFSSPTASPGKKQYNRILNIQGILNIPFFDAF
jgi:hypothetical protein